MSSDSQVRQLLDTVQAHPADAQAIHDLSNLLKEHGLPPDELKKFRGEQQLSDKAPDTDMSDSPGVVTNWTDSDVAETPEPQRKPATPEPATEPITREEPTPAQDNPRE